MQTLLGCLGLLGEFAAHGRWLAALGWFLMGLGVIIEFRTRMSLALGAILTVIGFLLALMGVLIPSSRWWVERRSERRCLMVVPVMAQPVDEQSNATGAPFSVVTRDISPKGIGLVHSEPIDQTLLALQMTLADEEVNVVADVQWCKAFGPFYYFGGKFVKKLQSFPQPGELA